MWPQLAGTQMPKARGVARITWSRAAGSAPAANSIWMTSRELLKYFSHFNDQIIQASDNFYSYQKPVDFRLERREVQVFSTREIPDPRLEENVRGTHA